MTTLIYINNFGFIVCTHGVYKKNQNFNLFGSAFFSFCRILKMAKSAEFCTTIMHNFLKISVTNDARKALYDF